MLLFPSAEFRKRRGRPNLARPTVALTLVAAEYEDAAWVRLTFDRPVDIAGLVGGAILVDDGEIAAVRWAAQGEASLLAPATVQVGLLNVGASSGPDVRLDAGPANGIVAADDGGTWAGVTGLLLPFP